MSVDHSDSSDEMSNQRSLSGLSDSRFSEKIRQTLAVRTPAESMVSALFYINLSTFLCISLAANGLSIQASSQYLIFAYGVIFISLFGQVCIAKFWRRCNPKNNAYIYSLVALIEDSSIVLALYFNAIAAQQVLAPVAIVCVCAATFLSVPLSTRLYSSFLLSKGVLFLGCIAYVFSLGDKAPNTIILIFPLIITFVFIFVLAYWLYLRQIKLLHQQYEQVELRQIIHEKNQLLHNAIAAEKATNTELTRAHTLREKIIRHIGHDLRQPINALNYSLFNMDMNTLSEDQREKIDIASKSVEAANYLIEEVLQISTYKKSELTPNLERFKISSLLTLIEREYALAVQQANCELRLVKCDLSVVSDFQLVSRIVKNFFSNAIRYASGSKILIGVRRRHERIEIQIIDNGPGIPLAVQDKLFEEFVIGDNAKNHESFGLGLSIAKHLAELCEAEVRVTSTLNKGTKCSLFLRRPAND